jgi:hypothetical protein
MATQARFTMSCILFVSHLPTHYLTPELEMEEKVMGLAEQEVTQDIVLLSAK